MPIRTPNSSQQAHYRLNQTAKKIANNWRLGLFYLGKKRPSEDKKLHWGQKGLMK